MLMGASGPCSYWKPTVLPSVALVAAVVAAVSGGVALVHLSFTHGVTAVGMPSKVYPIKPVRQMRAIRRVNLVIAVRLGIAVDDVVGHDNLTL